jgi:hypothetical protein
MLRDGFGRMIGRGEEVSSYKLMMLPGSDLKNPRK